MVIFFLRPITTFKDQEVKSFVKSNYKDIWGTEFQHKALAC